MKFYTGWQWLLIDAASQFGLDKLTFEKRIEWAEQHLDQLESLADQAETQPLYHKAVMAIRKTQQGIPTGHLVGVDASCSGIQVMSVMTGCEAGAHSTGLIDPDVRADAYTACTQAMGVILGNTVNVSRKDAKQALMTSFYGSKAQPKLLFGEDTDELKAFYQAAYAIAPGPWELLQDLLASWKPYSLYHDWYLPDGYYAYVKVMKPEKLRIQVEELDNASFTYQYYDNSGKKTGKSNVANITHSMDAYVLRCMHRRCNYDREMVEKASALIQMEMIRRHLEPDNELPVATGKVAYYIGHYERSTLADIVILPYLTQESVRTVPVKLLAKLQEIIQSMLQYLPFPIVTIHDEFKAHPNNVNWMRWQYKEILADIAESNVLDDLLSQLHGSKVEFIRPPCNNLPAKIRNSNYALC